MNEVTVHFDSEPHEKTKILKMSNDEGKVHSYSTENLTDVNNAYFQRELMEKNNGIKCIVANQFPPTRKVIVSLSLLSLKYIWLIGCKCNFRTLIILKRMSSTRYSMFALTEDLVSLLEIE